MCLENVLMMVDHAANNVDDVDALSSSGHGLGCQLFRSRSRFDSMEQVWGEECGQIVAVHFVARLPDTIDILVVVGFAGDDG